MHLAKRPIKINYNAIIVAAVARGEYNLSKFVVLKFDAYINKNMHVCS